MGRRRRGEGEHCDGGKKHYSFQPEPIVFTEKMQLIWWNSDNIREVILLKDVMFGKIWRKQELEIDQ